MHATSHFVALSLHYRPTTSGLRSKLASLPTLSAALSVGASGIALTGLRPRGTAECRAYGSGKNLPELADEFERYLGYVADLVSSAAAGII